MKEKKKIKIKYDVDILPSYNVCPKDSVLILDRNLLPRLLNWSFSPNWAKKPMNLINARKESLHEKPSFKNSERCIFVVDGYFEWMKSNTSKIPFYLHFNGNLMYFGGIYNLNGCCIVTKEANKNISFIHHRQPVLLHERFFSDWINHKYNFNSDTTKDIYYHRVSNKVNSTKNNDLSILDPIFVNDEAIY